MYMANYFIDESDYLEHYGRKGMRWYQHIFGKEASANRTYKSANRLATVYKEERDRTDKARGLYKRMDASKDSKEQWDLDSELRKLGFNSRADYVEARYELAIVRKTLDKKVSKLKNTEYGKELANKILKDLSKKPNKK